MPVSLPRHSMLLFSCRGMALGLLLWGLGLTACVSQETLPSQGFYQEMFDKDLFQERVRRLRSVNLGATYQEVMAALGEPQAREVTPEGHPVLVYRVRCYAGPEPFKRLPRLLSLTTESRIIFDGTGRVAATLASP